MLPFPNIIFPVIDFGPCSAVILPPTALACALHYYCLRQTLRIHGDGFLVNKGHKSLIPEIPAFLSKSKSVDRPLNEFSAKQAKINHNNPARR